MPALPSIDRFLSLERAYYEILSRWEPRPWGTMGYNPDNPDSHDCNHAYADGPLSKSQLPAVLREVRGGYQERGLQPLLRFYVPPNDPCRVQAAREEGWEANLEGESWRAWTVDAGFEPPNEVPGMTLKLAGPGRLDDLLHVQCEGKGGNSVFRIRKVWKALAESDHVDGLLAYMDGEPAAALHCLWNDGWGSVGNVGTRERFRRRGICAAMIRAMQQRATERGADGLYLYAVEEGPDRIYARAGFELVARVKQAHLFWEDTGDAGNG